MVQELEIFRAKIDVELDNKTPVTALDKIQASMASFMSETKGFQRQFKDIGGAISLGFEMPERKAGSFFALARAGFAQMKKGGIDTARGFDVTNYALAQVTDKVPALKGLSNAFAGLSRVGAMVSSAMKTVRLHFSGLEGDEKRVVLMMSEVSASLKTQASMWTATQKLAITETRGVISELKKQENQQNAIIRASERTLANPDASGEAMVMALMRQEEAKKKLIQVTTELSDAEATLAMQTAVQSPLLQRVTSNISTMDTAMKHIFESWETQQIIPERWVKEAERSVKTITTEMNRLQKVGMEVPPDIQKSFYQMTEGLTWAQGKAEEVAQKNATAQKTVGEETEKSSRKTKAATDITNIYSQSINSQSEKMTKVKTVIGQYSTKLTEAEQANKNLLRYVQPSSMMNAGLDHFGVGITKGAQAASTFSLSLGSMVGVAGAVGGALGQLNPAFSSLIVGVSRLADQFMRSFTAMISIAGTAAERIKAAVGVASASLTAFGVMAVGTIVSTGQLGMQVTTLEISLRQIAKNLAIEAGGNVEKFQQYVMNLRDTIIETGITTREATNAMLQFTRAKLPLEEVEALAQDAKNLAVTVSDMSSSEVYGRLIEVITTGNSQLLKEINIVKTCDQMYEEYAKTIDKTSSKELTIAEKRQAIIEGLHKETASIAGVYEAAMATAGKQLSSMKRLFEEAMLALGKRFEPMLAELIFGFNKILKWFTQLDPAILDGIANVVKFIATWGTLIGVVLSLIPLLKSLPAIFATIGAAAPWLLAIGAAVGAITFAITTLRKVWDNDIGGIQDKIGDFLSMIDSDVKPIFADLWYWLQSIWGEIKAIFDGATDFAADLVGALSDPIYAITGTLSELFQTLRDVVNGTFGAIWKVLRGFVVFLRGDTVAAASYFKNALIDVLTSIALLFKNTVGKAAVWGWNLIVGFANGITKAATSVLAKVMKFVGNAIGKFIRSKSPPESGPLHYITEWGKGLMAAYFRGFETADFGMIKDLLAPISQAFQNAVSLGDMDEADVIPATQRVREQLAGLLADFRKTGTVNEEIMSSISASLGEGGQDLMEYIRRVVAHQKALKALADVQKEYAEAEKSGFVRKELKDRLAAAEEQAKATEDAVSWQQEYLAAMQDTVDMQLQQLALLERMADAMEEMVDAFEDVGLGEMAEGELPFQLPDMTEMETAFADLPELAAEGLGKVSDEFLEMRQKVIDWIQSIKDWLALPLGEKIETIKDWLLDVSKAATDWIEDVTGIDLSKLGEQIGGALEDAVKWVEKLTGWDISTWAETIKTKIGDAWQWIVDKAQWLYDTLVGKSIIPDTVDKILSEFSRLNPLASTGSIWDKIKAKVTEFKNAVFEKLGLSGAKFDAFKQKVSEVFETIRVFAAPIIAIIVTPLQTIYEVIKGLFTELSSNEELQVAFQELWVALGELWTALQPILEPVVGLIGKMVLWFAILVATELVTFLTLLAAGLTAAKDAIIAAIPYVVDIVTQIVNWFTSLVKLETGIANFISGVLALFTGKIELAKERFGLAFENMEEAIKGFVESGLSLIADFFLMLLSSAVRYFASFIKSFVAFGTDILVELGIIDEDTATKITEFVDTIALILTGLWENTILGLAQLGLDMLTAIDGMKTSIIETLAGWVDIGEGFVENIKTGISNGWEGLITWFKGKLQSLKDLLPFSEPQDPTSPLRGLGKSGAALFKNMIGGMESVDVQGAFGAQLAGIAAQLQGATANQSTNTYHVNFSLPNVHDERSAIGVGQQLQRYFNTADVRSRSR